MDFKQIELTMDDMDKTVDGTIAKIIEITPGGGAYTFSKEHGGLFWTCSRATVYLTDKRDDYPDGIVEFIGQYIARYYHIIRWIEPGEYEAPYSITCCGLIGHIIPDTRWVWDYMKTALNSRTKICKI